jgi:hypothetical protein
MHTHLHGPNTLSERGSPLDRLVILSSRHVMFWRTRSSSALESRSLQLRLWLGVVDFAMTYDQIHAIVRLLTPVATDFEGGTLALQSFDEISDDIVWLTLLPFSAESATDLESHGCLSLPIYYICMHTQLPPRFISTSIISLSPSSINKRDPILTAF